MFDWLRDNWQFIVGAAIGLPGLIALYFQRRPHTLDYRVVINTPLLSPHGSRLPGLTLDYLGQRVERPHLIQLRIANSGKHAVTADEYATPITLALERSAPLDLFIADSSPEGLVHASDDGDELFANDDFPHGAYTFQPKLINPGDWFDVQMLCDGPPGHITVRSRFAGQSRPMRDRESLSSTYMTRFALAGSLTALVVAIIMAMVDNFGFVFVLAAFTCLYWGPFYFFYLRTPRFIKLISRVRN